MSRRNVAIPLCVGLLTAVLSSDPARAGFDSGSDGSDGPFNPVTNTVVDLSLAPTGSWDTPATGDGVYDPDLWVVVFKFTTIDVPAGVTVTFLNHPSGAPVVWLAQGDVTIQGTVNVSGKNGGPAEFFASPGPGGFAGGSSGTFLDFTQSAGFGPGGGPLTSSGSEGVGGSYATLGTGNSSNSTYGNANVLPPVGGSGGGGGSQTGTAGGAGGGALTIAANTLISIATGSAISARGGNGVDGGTIDAGSGSGGSIRLVAPTVSGVATALNATGGTGSAGVFGGGLGRIRVDADNVLLTGSSNPNYSTDQFVIPVFPPATYPKLKAVMVDSDPVPADPLAGIETTDVAISNPGDVIVAIEAANIPVGTVVIVHVIPGRGQRFSVNSTPLVDAGGGLLTATATVADFPAGRVEIQLGATW